MDSPHDHVRYPDAPATQSEAALRAAMDQSDREVAAGKTVPLEEILDRLDDLADRTEARLRKRPA
jgi:hypothetical protein